MSEDMKKVDGRVELEDIDLNQVAGGYSPENWSKMTPDERMAAYYQSRSAQYAKQYCAMDDPNA